MAVPILSVIEFLVHTAFSDFKPRFTRRTSASGEHVANILVFKASRRALDVNRPRIKCERERGGRKLDAGFLWENSPIGKSRSKRLEPVIDRGDPSRRPSRFRPSLTTISSGDRSVTVFRVCKNVPRDAVGNTELRLRCTHARMHAARTRLSFDVRSLSR